MSMTVSIIVPTCNMASALKRLLLSMQQLDPKPLEIIVVDDCSTDETGKVCGDFEEVKYLRMPRNVGPGGARNLGVKNASGDVLLFLDGDCEVLSKDLVGRHAAVHEETDNLLLSGAVVGMRRESFIGKTTNYCMWHCNIPSESKELLPAFGLPTAHVSIRKRDFERIGGFDEEIRAGEDTVLYWRARNCGLLTRRIADVVVRHHDIPFSRRFWCQAFENGKSRIPIKRKGVYGKYSFLLPENPFLLGLLAPVIAAGMTIRNLWMWLPGYPGALLYAPLMFVYWMAYPLGAIAFLRAESRDAGKREGR